MKVLLLLYRFIGIFTSSIVSILLSLMVINTFFGVVFRYVLNIPVSWTEELARYLMIWFGFLGMVIVLRDGEHVTVSLVVERLPAKIRSWIKLFNLVLIAAFLAVTFQQSIEYMDVLGIQVSPALQIPMIWPYLSVTVGSLLMLIEDMRLIALHWKGISRSR